MSPARLIFLDDAPPAQAIVIPSALVIGNFDGVHKGHRAVLSEAVAQSRRAGGFSSAALTFHPHPAEIVGRGAPPLLTSLEDRAELMGPLGVERLYVRRFDEAFAAWSPERFAEELVVRTLRAKLVVVGENFRFGARRRGDLALLRSLGRDLGFEVRVHGFASDAKGLYSSTRARDAVFAGDLGEAHQVLGRPHAITGIVAHGDARGRTLGFPTANLDAVAELLPPRGVYAVAVDRKDEIAGGYASLAMGLTNIGVRPTVAAAGKTSVETHLLNFDGDLYGAGLRVHFLARLRPEAKFESLEALKAQIAKDVEGARAIFAARSRG